MTTTVEQLRSIMQRQYLRGRVDGYQVGLDAGYEEGLRVGREKADADLKEAIALLLSECAEDTEPTPEQEPMPTLTDRQQQAFDWLKVNQPTTYSEVKRAGWGGNMFYRLCKRGVVRREDGQFFVVDTNEQSPVL